MKNNKGITLITVIMTVLLLAIIAGLAISHGVDTFNNSKIVKFEAYMRMIQKKVDLVLEENVDYMTLGQPLTETSKQKLQTVISTDNKNYIVTDDVEEDSLRYFSSGDIETYFQIKDVDDEIIVNFSEREVISLNGVEKDGVTYYVEYGLH